MIVRLAMALLAAAAQPADEPDTDGVFSERQPVRLTPLPATSALAAFRDICMATFPDPAAFDQAAAASPLGFARGAGTERGTQEWTSAHGQIILRQAPNREREARRDRRRGHASRRRWTVRCEFWLAVDERLDPASLARLIGTELAPQSRPAEEILGVSWDLGSTSPGISRRLVYLPSSDDERLFTLSLEQSAEAPVQVERGS